MPIFRILARLKFLRGGPLDIFGYTSERKAERELIESYELDIERLIAETGNENLNLAVEIASLPEKIRGFGHVKKAGIEASRMQRDVLWHRISCDCNAGPECFNP